MESFLACCSIIMSAQALEF